MTPTLVALAVTALFAPPAVEALYFKGFGRWQDTRIDAAVQRFYASGTPANERAELAASPLVRPYLYLSAKRLGKVEGWEEDPILMALAATIQRRLESEEFAKRIDLLMEAGIIAANKPPDPKDAWIYKWREPPPVGRHTDPAVTAEAVRQMQTLLVDLGSNSVIDGYLARLEKGGKRRQPSGMTTGMKGSGSFYSRTSDELLRMSSSGWSSAILAGDKLQITDDRPSVYLSSGTFLLRYGMHLRPNTATPQPAVDEFAARFFVCGDTAHFGPPLTMLDDHSVVVVDGDLTLPGYSLNDSLFIASGSIHITGPWTVRNSWFVAGGTITASKAFDTDTNTFVAGGKVAVQAKDEKKPGVRIEDKTKADLGLNFFRTEEVGVTFDPKEIKAVVKAAADDSPFRHVLKPGDVVTGINDREVRNAGAARRALREAVVLGFAFVTRTRGSDPATMTLVSLPGSPKPVAKTK